MATFETSGLNGSTIDQSNFREIIAFLRPKPEELHWRKIPWQTDLRDACRLAAEERKPIFLWAMNGNPLGCT